MVYTECKVYVYKNMAEMGTEPDSNPDSESKIWRLTGFESGFLVFGTRSGFAVNFSNSANLW